MDGDAPSRAMIEAATAVVETAAASVIRLGGNPDAVAAILWSMSMVPLLEAWKVPGLSPAMEDMLARLCSDMDAAGRRMSAILPSDPPPSPPPPSNVVPFPGTNGPPPAA